MQFRMESEFASDCTLLTQEYLTVTAGKKYSPQLATFPTIHRCNERMHRGMMPQQLPFMEPWPRLRAIDGGVAVYGTTQEINNNTGCRYRGNLQIMTRKPK